MLQLELLVMPPLIEQRERNSADWFEVKMHLV